MVKANSKNQNWYIVVSNEGGRIYTHSDWDIVQEWAKRHKEKNDHEEIEIFTVTRGWTANFPEEPDVEIYNLALEND